MSLSDDISEPFKRVEKSISPCSQLRVIILKGLVDVVPFCNNGFELIHLLSHRLIIVFLRACAFLQLFSHCGQLWPSQYSSRRIRWRGLTKPLSILHSSCDLREAAAALFCGYEVSLSF